MFLKLLLVFSPNFSVTSNTLRYFLKMAILKVKSAFGTIYYHAVNLVQIWILAYVQANATIEPGTLLNNA